jgi:hypothetical protein
MSLHATNPLMHSSELYSQLHDEDLVIGTSFYVTGYIVFAITSKGIQAVNQQVQTSFRSSEVT